jgi:DNA-binding MarR family transcriptional regulator
LRVKSSYAMVGAVRAGKWKRILTMATQTKEAFAASDWQRNPDAPLRLETFLPYQLNVVASVVSQALSRLYAERYAIGVPEWRVLVTLGEFETMTGKAIGEHSHMHKTKVSRAVALLEKRNLVVRRVNRSDLREAFLSLTPEGRAIYNDLAPGAIDFARHLTEAIDPADREAFARALQQLIKRAKPLAEQAIADPDR